MLKQTSSPYTGQLLTNSHVRVVCGMHWPALECDTNYLISLLLTLTVLSATCCRLLLYSSAEEGFTTIWIQCDTPSIL